MHALVPVLKILLLPYLKGLPELDGIMLCIDYLLELFIGILRFVAEKLHNPLAGHWRTVSNGAWPLPAR